MSVQLMNLEKVINVFTINHQKENDIIISNNVNVDIKEIVADLVNIKRAEEIFYVCNLDAIIKRYQLWLKKMPYIMPYYAVKCNDHDVVLKLLGSLGIGFDCASINEILKLKNINVPSEHIIFANPTKIISQIKTARLHGVELLAFDCESELLKIKEHHPNAKLLLRFRSEAKTAFRKLGNKFGCDPIVDGKRLIQMAKKEGMNLVGVTFHVGTGCTEALSYRRAIGSSRQLFDIAKEVGFNLSLLDIGGGFPGDEASDGLFNDMVQIIHNSLKCYFSDIDRLRVVAEPGRFFITTAFTLASCIHSKKVLHTTEGRVRKFMYTICDGIYGSFSRITYSKQISPVQSLKKFKKTKLYNTLLWGPTCDGLDQIPNDVLLPELEIGDWVFFENMGAYSITVTCNFNGFGVLPIMVYVSETTSKLIQQIQPTEQISLNNSD